MINQKIQLHQLQVLLTKTNNQVMITYQKKSQNFTKLLKKKMLELKNQKNKLEKSMKIKNKNKNDFNL